MHWGHKVASREGPVEVTRLQYNEQAGADTPDQPDVPACAEHVYDWWWELNARRAPGFDYSVPLSYAEIGHWRELTGKLIDDVEIRWLVTMDDAWLEQIAVERKARQDKEDEERERKKTGKR